MFDFMSHCEVIVLKTSWFWCGKRCIDHQVINIEEPKVNPCSFNHLILDKDGKNIHLRKHSMSTKCFFKREKENKKNDIHIQKNEARHVPFYKMMWIKFLRILYNEFSSVTTTTPILLINFPRFTNIFYPLLFHVFLVFLNNLFSPTCAFHILMDVESSTGTWSP